jgi:predicted cupin superfamily sugar epimerase
MHSSNSATYWIENLKLLPHPEGGYYREVYRATEVIPHSALPQRFAGARAFATSIYYLLEQGDFSAFHRIHSDETWHFYAGGALEIFMLGEGAPSSITLGADVAQGQHLQFTVPAGAWFASRPKPESAYSLVGCTVSPGFDFNDFTMADRRELSREFPQALQIIESLTRPA